MKSILFEEAKRHGINNLYDLQETDNWVNDSTRKEINWILNNKKVFGVTENNGYTLVEPYQLRDARNFSVKLLFDENKRDFIAEKVQAYNCKTDFCMNDLAEFIKVLFDNSCYVCTWV
jgi:hypothetical protein